ncbi:DUF1659 domain-containing protein [Halobacillus litoralis]|uniref:DUF1659 domain-containing protein n=1 Tax=Halobacillus litoralis TaxID=45668 RepID=A0A845DR12_9BACI|nr:DUF1659 domain-containing protein [Halobacillus litoralis]MCA1023476.1 DUF1659 domain-containing protein [Halobacillus litoralis]MYL18985.1 DUF1659 domain-containing protein [Halobacillus litoralis]MYL39382.1 DUF1659 domain-containing protein [Halobacillus litoralis]
MAVTNTRIDSRLQLVLAVGQDEEGNMVYKTKSFNNMKTEASDEQLYQTAAALAPLQQHILEEVARDNRSILTEE